MDEQDPQNWILVVDDEPAIGSLIQRAAESLRVEIRHASSAAEALETARQDRHSLGFAILDVMLPDRPGEALYRDLRREFGNFPILFITGQTQASRVMDILEQDPMTDLLPKPFSLKPLRAFLALAQAHTVGAPGPA